jgi:hypothetical protein
MDSLPTELLSLILLSSIRQCRCEKNAILPLRFVCRSFDAILKPYVFKTIQLEFSRFLRQRRGGVEERDWDGERERAREGDQDEGRIVRGLEGHGSGLEGVWGGEGIGRGRMDGEGLRRVGAWCEALYLDLMVVRDEGTFLDFSFFAGFVRIELACADSSPRGDNPPVECFPRIDSEGPRNGTFTRIPSQILYERHYI